MWTPFLALLTLITQAISLLFFEILVPHPKNSLVATKIAQLIFEQATTPSIQLVPQLATTLRADSDFNSTDALDVLLPQDFHQSTATTSRSSSSSSKRTT